MAGALPDPPVPVPGTRRVLRIQDLAFGGEGVARDGDFVVFVPFVIPGEEVEVELLEVKKKFARARLCRILSASPLRVQPRCRYFGQCGGCQYQHIDYPAQLELKRKQVVDLLERIGGFSRPPVAPVIPCPRQYHYRNRILVRSQWDKFKQGLNLGFIRAQDRLVVDVEECAIAEPELNLQLREVRAHPPPKGGIKVQLRTVPADWEVPDHSFFQNNFHLLSQLADAVRARIRDSGAQHLIDLYCGVGFFAIELAGDVARFVGVEIDVAAVQAARRNAARRGIHNGEFIAGSAEAILPSLLGQWPPRESVAVIDPPRTGCSPQGLQLLLELDLAQLLYVSCHPATLARDLKHFCAEAAYRLEAVTPLDLFPHTQHVECVADLRRTKMTLPNGLASA
jgi:tRNA/tmRNA/rRNA uracil-C5-methylase (TrmA/RlmC/RlmD family)